MAQRVGGRTFVIIEACVPDDPPVDWLAVWGPFLCFRCYHNHQFTWVNEVQLCGSWGGVSWLCSSLASQQGDHRSQGSRRKGGTASVLTLMSGPVCPSSVEERAVELPEFAAGGCSSAALQQCLGSHKLVD